MRLALIGLAAAQVVHVPASPASCAPVIAYRGVLYFGVAARTHVRAAGRVRATTPGCNDVTPAAKEPARRIWVRRIAGVSPRVGLVQATEPQLVYIATGLFPEVPSFPLHRAFYGRANEPQECHGVRPQVALLIRGRVGATPFPFAPLRVRTEHGAKLVFVDASTRLSYPATHRLVRGRRVVITTGICGRKLVARRIDLR